MKGKEALSTSHNNLNTGDDTGLAESFSELPNAHAEFKTLVLEISFGFIYLLLVLTALGQNYVINE
jgi:hypothetical protein